MDPLTRRSFLNKTGIAALGIRLVAEAAGPGSVSSSEPEPVRYGVARSVIEWAYTSNKAYTDPFNDVELSIVFTDPKGSDHRIPAFWSGDQVWRIRFSPASPGRYTYHTIASDGSNLDLHGRRGVLEVSPYAGDNPLRKHGPIRV